MSGWLGFLVACGGADETTTADADADADTDADADADADADSDADSDSGSTVTTGESGVEACDLRGSWTGTFGKSGFSTPVRVLYDGSDPASGTSTLMVDSGPLSGTIVGTWTLAADELSVNDTSSTGMSTCDPGDTGVYTLTWTEDCDHVDFAKVSDPCLVRAGGFDGMALDRL